MDFQAQRLRSLRNHRWFVLPGKKKRKSLEIGVRCVFGILVFSCFFGILAFFAERRLLSTLNFLLCSSTNLNVLLAICMFFCFLEGLWDDLNLERLSIKTNDLWSWQRKDMMFFSDLQFVSLRTHGLKKLQNYTFPEPEPEPRNHGAFPWADVSSCQSNLSGEICRTSFGTHFLGGGKGMGSKIVFGRIFLFLRIFVVEIETVLVWKDINWRTRPANHFHDFNFFNTSLVTPVLLAESNMSKSLGKILDQNNRF